ncbi:MAG: hypothetical protein KC731_32840, partial [Myxococcales bacterium]|nr:hypothetical protein [Myxococcales bacterium]
GAWLDALADEGAHVEARVASACARLDPPASGWLREAIQSLDLTGLARTLANAPPGQAPRRAAEWFDAFQTRKLVHALRDLGFGEVPWWEALRAPFCGLDLSPATSTAVLFAACARLAELEREPRPTWPAGVGRRPRAPL